MPTLRDADFECHVLTFKDGVLSAIAHDLKISVDRGSLTFEEEGDPRVEATFDPQSLRVVCARKDGRDMPSALGPGDRKKIEANIQKDVLHTKKHGEIRFVSRSISRDGDRATLTGDLTLHGRTQPLTVTARKEGDAWITEVPLHQPDFGITPYSAMLGTLKIQPTVRVVLRVPA